MRRALLVGGVIAVIVVAVYFFRISAIQKARNDRAAKMKAIETETVIPVRVTPVTTGEVEKVLRYTGTVESAERVDVYSKIAGRIVSMKVREGDAVAKDEPIAVVDPEVTGQKFEPFEITAPLTGKISDILLDPGAFVTQMMPIIEIINDTSVKVTINVLEKDYHLVGKGTPVRIEFDALPGKVRTASITNRSPVVDRMTGTAKAEVNLANQDGMLKTGMFARVQVVVETHRDAIIVPREATVSEVLAGFDVAVRATVFVVSGDRAQERQVKIGLASTTYYEVLEGLTPGEMVVVAGQNLLRDGTRVSISSSGT